MEWLLRTDSWPARWHCGQWTALHGWITILSDITIFLCYMSIPALLWWHILRPKHQLIQGISALGWLFVAFIAFCGLEHALQGALFWWPAYHLDTSAKTAVALVSIPTVLALARILPQVRRFIRAKQQAEADREELQQDRESLLAGMAHNLKGPPRRALQALSALQKEYEISGENMAFATIVRQLRYLRHLQNTILAWYRHSSREEMESVDVEEVVREIQSVEDLTVREIQSVEDLTVHASALPTVFAQPGKLHMIIESLFQNALKYNESPEPTAWINASVTPEYWQFSVRDNGIGIPADKQELIFEPFKRAHPGYTGQGLGLFLVQQFVGQHGGRIWVESSPGEGSIFYFTIRRPT